MVARLCLLFVVLSFLDTGGLPTCAAEPRGNEVAGEKKKEASNETSPQEDRYAVPAGDLEQLVAFIDRLVSYRPTTAAEFSERRKRLPVALQLAAKRILELDKSRQSKAARTAQEILLSRRVQELPLAGRPEQKKVYGELKDFVTSAQRVSRRELALALAAVRALERLGNTDLASEGYDEFGDFFSDQDDEFLADYGAKMRGVARRLRLPGKEMELAGTAINGTDFDWKDYRGKVVLVDFWATWCRPCVRELPKVKQYFEAYRDRGFDVVGISLDTDRARLESFVKDAELPWVTLFEDDAGWQHPMATHYGIMGIPAAILVDRDGTVLSINADGPDLARQLNELLGPPAGSDEFAKHAVPASEVPGDKLPD